MFHSAFVIYLESDIPFFVRDVNVEVLVPHGIFASVVNGLSFELFTVNFDDDERVHLADQLYITREFGVDDGKRPLEMFGFDHLICN